MTVKSVAIWVVLTVSGVSPAWAADPPRKVEGGSDNAASRFQIAVELYHEGNYAGALAEFKKAYQISPSYRVLFNIAQTQYALGDFVSAYKSLNQYRSEGGDGIPAERVTQVNEMSGKLAERIAYVTISSNVAGAEIRVDDVSVGTSPLPGPVSVNVGTRRISAVDGGRLAAVRVVTVAGRETAKVELQFEQPVASVPVAAPDRLAAIVKPAPISLVAREEAPSIRRRTLLIVGLSTTAALALGTGVAGYLAVGAQRDLQSRIDTYPTTRADIEEARTRSKNYGYAVDALGAATVIAGAATLYVVLTHREDTEKAGHRRPSDSAFLAPTVGGMVLHGSF
jgi:hypothetical protein